MWAEGGRGLLSLACFFQFFCFRGTNGKGFDSRVSDFYHPIAVLPVLCGQRKQDSCKPQNTDGPSPGHRPSHPGSDSCP